MIRSLGLRSDLMVLRGRAVAEDHADRIVLRTPAEPDYWYGNMMIFRDGSLPAEAQVAQFRDDFPEADHVTLAWDVPGMVRGPLHERLVALGFEIDEADVLSLPGPLVNTPPPEGIAIRPLARTAEWEQAIALQVETGLEDGFEPAVYARFARDRFRARRQQAAEGWAAWLGAFEGDRLVGDLGIFVGEGIARFQSVETRASHRRRGICAALVTAGTDWAAARDAAAVPVIVADRDGAAGRVYRRCGFGVAETLLSALRRPASALNAL